MNKKIENKYICADCNEEFKSNIPSEVILKELYGLCPRCYNSAEANYI
jgi:DNA-directed RNA polymerase subunit RPC12/RpoP